MSYSKNQLKAARLSMIMLVAFSLLFLNVVRMQVVRGSYYRGLSEKNRVRVLYLEGPRGKILDRLGRELASNRLSFNCSAIPGEAKLKIDESLRTIAGILNQDVQALEKSYRKKKVGVFNTVLVAQDISAEQAMAIEERLDSLPGFLIETRPQREYPYGEAAAHLTGYIGPINEEEVDQFEFQGYRSSDWLGRDGVEKTYENYLKGRSGGLQMEVNNRGRFVRALGVQEPKEGRDIQLTIDAELQSFIHQLMASQKGAVMVMELEEGGILAMNSAPSFDPNLFASTAGRKNVGKYITDALSPMMNRCIRGQYPAGSIFKIVTALAALESHKISAHSWITCGGHWTSGGIRFHCWNEKGHGPQDMTQAFAHSCNVFFYTIGVSTGVDAIQKKAMEFGFGRRAGIDLAGESLGVVPSREWKKKTKRAGWFDGDTANLSIGQGFLQVTPLQTLEMIAAVATDGQWLKPHVLDKIDGIKVSERHAASVRVNAEDLALVKQGLDQVVNSETGTGRLARVEGLRIAGKTGTAQSGQDKNHAWFVGYAPTDRPKFAVLVFAEHGGRGGVTAASLAGSVFHWLKEKAYF